MIEWLKDKIFGKTEINYLYPKSICDCEKWEQSDIQKSLLPYDIEKEIKKIIVGNAGAGMKAKTLLASLEAMVGGSFDNMDSRIKTADMEDPYEYLLKTADKEMKDSYEYLLKNKGEYWANRYRKISTLGAKRDFLNDLGITKDMVTQHVTNR